MQRWRTVAKKPALEADQSTWAKVRLERENGQDTIATPLNVWKIIYLKQILRSGLQGKTHEHSKQNILNHPPTEKKSQHSGGKGSSTEQI